MLDYSYIIVILNKYTCHYPLEQRETLSSPILNLDQQVSMKGKEQERHRIPAHGCEAY